MAWQQHFVTNMFIRPETPEEIKNFTPDFTVINACSQVNEDWEKHGLNSDVAVASYARSSPASNSLLCQCREIRRYRPFFWTEWHWVRSFI